MRKPRILDRATRARVTILRHLDDLEQRTECGATTEQVSTALRTKQRSPYWAKPHLRALEQTGHARRAGPAFMCSQPWFITGEGRSYLAGLPEH